MFILLLAAVALTPSQRLQRDFEDRARAELTDLFRSLCPEQCVLLALEARVDDELVGTAAPGFDAPGDLKAPVVKVANATIVLDGKLPSAFRGKVRDLVTQRLQALGVPARVAVQAVQFPVRNPPHLEAPPTPSLPPPAANPPPPVAPEAKAATLQDRLLEQAPALASLLLLTVVALILGVLLFFAVRRPAEHVFDSDVSGVEPGAPGPQELRFPEARRRKLEKSLVDERPVRNAIVREALANGEVDLVARWVRELGEFLLDDLAADAAIASALTDVASRIARVSPDPAALVELEGRLIGARLRRAAENADAAFSFLEGVRPEAFAAACRDLGPGALDVALRFAPSQLRTAALQQLPAEARRELALGWMRRPEVAASYAASAADELRERLARMAGGPRQAEVAMSDLLDSLERDEQDLLIERMRREPGGASGKLLVSESALGGAPKELLVAALLRVAPERLVTYLAGADASLREKVLSAYPAKLRRDLEEELQVRATPQPAEFLAARKEVLSRLREETARRSISPTEVRRWSNGAAERARAAAE
jgi:flagellar motor switch protein FliG